MLPKEIVINSLDTKPNEGAKIVFWKNKQNRITELYVTTFNNDWKTVTKYLGDEVIGWSLHKPWKIIAGSNFDDESFAEYIICENIESHETSLKLLEAMNKDISNNSRIYHRIVLQEYTLWRGMEEFI